MIDDTTIDDVNVDDTENEPMDDAYDEYEQSDSGTENDAYDDAYDEYEKGDDEKYDDVADDAEIPFDSNDHHEITGDDVNMGFDGTEFDLVKHHPFPEIPESQAIDTKAIRGSSSTSGSGTSSMFDPFGTGELYDESSAAASFALLGFVLVIIMGACVYMSFRQTMIVTPTHKNGGSSKQGLATLPSFSKRRE